MTRDQRVHGVHTVYLLTPHPYCLASSRGATLDPSSVPEPSRVAPLCGPCIRCVGRETHEMRTLTDGAHGPWETQV